MRSTIRILLLGAMLLSVPVVPSRGATTLVSYSFQGTLTNVSGLAAQAPPTGLGIANGDYITGTFAYQDTATGTAGLYNMTGKADSQSFAISVYSPSNLSVPVFSDNYLFTSTSFYEAKVSYNSTTKNTTLALQGDTSYKSGAGYSYASTGVPAFVLTLTNPGSAGGFSATALKLPTPAGQPYSITNFLSTNGTLSWDPPNLSFMSFDISYFRPIAQYQPPPPPTVPEPSGLMMAVLALSTSAVGSMFARGRGGLASRRDRQA